MPILPKLRLKLAFGLTAVLAGAFALYLGLARQTLLVDKQNELTQAQRQQVEALSERFESRIEQALLDARAIVAGVDVGGHRPAPAAEHLFWQNAALLALDVQGANHVVFSLEKFPGLLAGVAARVRAARVEAVGPERFRITAPLGTGTLRLRVIVEDASALGHPRAHQVLALVDRGEFVTKVPAWLPPPSTLPHAPGAIVAIAHSRFNNLSFVAAMPTHGLFAAFEELYRRAYLFLLSALLLAFALAFGFGRAYSHALRHVFRRAGDRREASVRSELTALHQARVRVALNAHQAPTKNSYANGQVRLEGELLRADADRGDWWDYRQVGAELMVVLGDVIGRGVDATLGGATARAALAAVDVFSIERLATALERAASNSPMAALILKINVETGATELLNAGLPATMLFGQRTEFIVSRANPRFGEGPPFWHTEHFYLAHGDRLLMHTDGLFQLHPTWGDRRWLDALAQNKTLDCSRPPTDDILKVTLSFGRPRLSTPRVQTAR